MMTEHNMVEYQKMVRGEEYNACDAYLIQLLNLKSASNLNGNLNCSKELEHYAS